MTSHWCRHYTVNAVHVVEILTALHIALSAAMLNAGMSGTHESPCRLRQSCPRVQFLQPNPPNDWTNPTHNETELQTTNNSGLSSISFTVLHCTWSEIMLQHITLTEWVVDLCRLQRDRCSAAVCNRCGECRMLGCRRLVSFHSLLLHKDVVCRRPVLFHSLLLHNNDGTLSLSTADDIHRRTCRNVPRSSQPVNTSISYMYR